MPLLDHISGQSVLVTGASGFIGSHLCRRLCGVGARVSAVSRADRAADLAGPRWVRGDIDDIASVRRLLGAIKPDVIFHLASHVAGARDLELVLPTFHGNLMTTVNLLTAATEIGCQRIVVAGSLEEPDAGEAAAVPCSPYAAAKWAGSAYARMFHQLYQTPVVIARLFMVYGPDQPDLRKLVPYVITSLLQEQAPRLSSGQRQVDWIYVDDVVDGLLAAAWTPGVEGRTIELGSGRLTPIHAVVRQIVELIGARVEPIFGTLPDRPMEQVRVADIGATYRALGWRPNTALKQGLQHTIDWYRRQQARSAQIGGAAIG
jgi:nucleoside-diphosphate-sugar epimerase